VHYFTTCPKRVKNSIKNLSHWEKPKIYLNSESNKLNTKLFSEGVWQQLIHFSILGLCWTLPIVWDAFDMSRRFGSWFYSCFQVTEFYYTDRCFIVSCIVTEINGDGPEAIRCRPHSLWSCEGLNRRICLLFVTSEMSLIFVVNILLRYLLLYRCGTVHL
jgi:hypothetical protein